MNRRARLLLILVIGGLLGVGGAAALRAEDAPALSTIEGRVVDEKGKPIAGATVGAKVRGRRYGKPMLLGTTDASGRYRLEAERGRVPTRLKGVAASAPGYPTRAVTPDRQEEKDGVTRFLMKDVVLMFTGVARGRAVLANGKGVAGAVVRIHASTPGGSSHGYGDVPSRWAELGGFGRRDNYREPKLTTIRTNNVADKEGRFAVTTVRAAGYLVVVSAPSGPPKRLDVPASKRRPGEVVLELGPVTVKAPGTMRVRFLDPDGKPMAKCRAQLWWKHPREGCYMRIWESPEVLTDDEGWARLPFAEEGVAYDLAIYGGGRSLEAEGQVLAPGGTLRPALRR